MRVLVFGANGFIGGAIAAAFRARGHIVRAVVRDAAKFIRRFPDAETVEADLRDEAAQHPSYWRAALDGVDAVVYAAGVLQPRNAKVAWALHLHVPLAVYNACIDAGVRRVVHVSAIGVEESETVFARSKRAGDAALMGLQLDWTVLRPAVVIGDGSYGGTSMLRALAAVPFRTPVIGNGENEMGFIHKDDLAAAVVILTMSDRGVGQVLEPASRERTSLKDSVERYREWLGLPLRRVWAAPSWFVHAIARIGDVVKLDPVTSTVVAQFESRMTGNAETFIAATGVNPRGLSATLAGRPADAQDLWHARLYLLRPVIRFTLCILWLVSGILGVTAPPDAYAGFLGPFADYPWAAAAIAWTTSAIDLGIAFALLFACRLRTVASIQMTMVIAYTAGLTVMAPALWGDLLGSILKNIPIFVLIVVHRILEEER